MANINGILEKELMDLEFERFYSITQHIKEEQGMFNMTINPIVIRIIHQDDKRFTKML